MPKSLTEEKPIFLQIAERMEDAILSGAFPEEGQLPSTTEISAAYRINPATALKGIGLLVEEGAAHKQRGVGMFVSKGARERIREKRQRAFFEDYVGPLISEARKLGIAEQEILSMMERGYKDET
jgi:DNA-binding transcriptional regulator YhcF (GntR family)